VAIKHRAGSGRPPITPSATPSDLRMAASRFDAIRMATTGGDNLLCDATPSALRMAATDGHDRMARFSHQYSDMKRF